MPLCLYTLTGCNKTCKAIKKINSNPTYRINNHLWEEIPLARDELRAHCSRSALLQQGVKFGCIWLVYLHGHLTDLLQGQLQRPAHSFYDNARMHALLHKRFDLPQKLTGQKYDARRAVAYFRILWIKVGRKIDSLIGSINYSTCIIIN